MALFQTSAFWELGPAQKQLQTSICTVSRQVKFSINSHAQLAAERQKVSMTLRLQLASGSGAAA